MVSCDNPTSTVPRRILHETATALVPPRRTPSVKREAMCCGSFTCMISQGISARSTLTNTLALVFSFWRSCRTKSRLTSSPGCRTETALPFTGRKPSPPRSFPNTSRHPSSPPLLANLIAGASFVCLVVPRRYVSRVVVVGGGGYFLQGAHGTSLADFVSFYSLGCILSQTLCQEQT